MTQVSPVEPTEKSSATQPYLPALKTVLGTLDVKLDEELARYRRKRGIKTFTNATNKRSQPKKGLDLIAIRATGGRSQPPDVEEMASPVSLPASISASVPQVEANNGYSDISNPVQPAPAYSLDSNPIAQPEFTPTLTQPEVATYDTHPDRYLESSEALLKNLEEKRVAHKQERTFTDNLFTPLGVGSMLLLLLSSATLGYVAVNPSSLSHLPFGGIFGSRSTREAKDPQQTASVNVAKTGDESIPNSPNLASQEFVELNLRTLSTITPRNPRIQPLAAPSPQLPVKQPAPLPNPVASPVPLDLPSALLPQSIQSGVLPQIGTQPPAPLPPPTLAGQQPTVVNQPNKPNSGKPQPQASSAKAAPAKPKAAPARENKFLVVMSYNGDRSLTQAKKSVPDAHLRDLGQGKAIQLAAFPTQAEAQKKVAALRKQGISARIAAR